MSGFFQQGLKHICFGDIVWKAAGGSDIRACLVDSADYTPNLATDEFRSSIAAAGIEEDMAASMTLVDAAADGVVDASDVTFTATAGDQCEMIVVYKWAASEATKILLFMWDAASGLPVTLGGDVTVAWDNGVNKIARI